MDNLLIHGDNIDALNYLIKNERLRGKVDLVYIDPPFATGDVFTISDNRASTISNSRDGVIAYSDILLGKEYIAFLKKRILLLHKLLSPQGSIYLHIDYKIGHYVKVMMDSVFGMNNFRNDITRVKCNPKNFARLGYGNIKDLILFYTKTSDAIWNEPYEPYSEEDIQRLFPKVDDKGRRYTSVPIHAPGESKNPLPFKGMFPPEGRHWRTDVDTLLKWDEDGLIEWSPTGNPRKKIFADEKTLTGKRVQDIWTGLKDPQNPSYPTEKNEDLLRRIISTSSDKESIVLDCFCGSGTTLHAAEKLGRKWIGIDSSNAALDATRKKLGKESHYKEIEL